MNKYVQGKSDATRWKKRLSGFTPPAMQPTQDSVDTVTDNHDIIGRSGLRSASEQAFIEAVEQAMEGPFIRYSKRLKLVELAEKMHISRFQANLLIAQVQLRSDKTVLSLLDRKPSRNKTRKTADEASEGWRDKMIIAAGIFLVAALVNLMLIHFVFGGFN